MKKLLLTTTLLFCLSLFAQDAYFDLGVGVGLSSTIYDSQLIDNQSSGVTNLYHHSDLAFDIGGKIGVKTVNDRSFYIVADVFWANYSEGNLEEIRISNLTNSVKINTSHLFFGPGFVFYPISSIQFASSIGWVRTNAQVKYVTSTAYQKNSETYNSFKIGYGLNTSVAVDFSGRGPGILLGVKGTVIKNDIKINTNSQSNLPKLNLDLSDSYVSMFIKYRYR